MKGHYLNIRSTILPAGEIRGQLVVVPEPSTIVIGRLAALGLLIMALRRR